MEYIYWILMFAIGWVCSSIWNYIFNLGSAALMMQNVTYALACYIRLMHDSSLEFMQIKYNGLKEGTVTENSIKLLRITDEQTANETRSVLVKLMIEKYPKGFKHLLEFNNWSEMNNYIRKHQKE